MNPPARPAAPPTRRPLRGLYAITDGATGDRLLAAVEQALAGGARVIQYRDKTGDRERRLAEVRAVTAACHRHEALCVVNDDVELALAAGADGVHLGRDDAAIDDARRRLGPRAVIGVSCYNSLERARRAQAAGADYIAFGSFFASPTKPGAVRAPLSLLRIARAFTDLPLVAIGGITEQNGAAPVEAGADMLAVISGVFAAADPRAAARGYAALFHTATTTPEGRTMSRSHDLFNEARRHIPGGVNSPVRAFRGVGGDPVFFERGEGAYVWDADGRRYIDYVASWGPMVLGHAHPAVVRAVQETAAKGLSFGAPTEIETRMAQRVKDLVPSMAMVRMVSSGTEATMSAIRLARGHTGRDTIIKFEGCYHGHADSLLVKAGSGALTLGVPTSPGVPADLARHTLTLDYNDIAQVREVFAQMGEKIACVIVEPVAGNMNCVPPLPGFLEGLRELCTQYDSVLIFDEVMTGFRVALGGAQAHYGVTPDLTTLGKVIGGGLPVGAFGGKRAIMEKLAPLGPVYQAGTLSGNPVAMAAGLATLEHIAQPGFFEEIAAKVRALTDGIVAVAKKRGVPLTANRVGGMFGLFFTDAPAVHNFAQVTACDVERFKKFFHAMLDEGVYLAPSAYEAGFVSGAHTNADIEATIAAADRALGRV